MGIWLPGPGPTNGNDTYNGDASSEDVSGLAGNDTLNGGAGVDWLRGDAGDDTLNGGPDRDFLYGGGGRDSYDGGEGLDWATLDFSAEVLPITVLNDDPTIVFQILRGGLAYGTLVGVENLTIYGGAGDDIFRVWAPLDNLLMAYNGLFGGAGNDTLYGGAGIDTLSGGPGDDYLDGGAGGADSVDYSAAVAGVVVDLSLIGPQNTQGAGVDTILNVEGIGGSAFNDILHLGASAGSIGGGDGDDQLFGGSGVDTLRGDSGNDTIDGGGGDDNIDGGLGDDLVHGGDGDDWLVGEIVYGDAGNDHITAGPTSQDLVRGETLFPVSALGTNQLI